MTASPRDQMADHSSKWFDFSTRVAGQEPYISRGLHINSLCQAMRCLEAVSSAPLPCVSHCDGPFLKGSVYVNNTSSLPFKRTKNTHHNAHRTVLISVFLSGLDSLCICSGGKKLLADTL